MSLAARLDAIDRRFVFVLIAVTLCAPFFFQWEGCIDVKVTPPVRQAYDFIDKLPEGSRVLVSFDYGPSIVAEVGPGAVAILKHLMRRKMRIVGVALWPDAPALARELLPRLAADHGYRAYEDWTFLGYKYGGPTGSGVIEPMGTRFTAVFPTTVAMEGAPARPSNETPVLQGVEGYKDFALLVSFSSGTPGVKEYIQMANSRYKVPVITAVSRVTAPELYPFLNSGQLAGLVAGVTSGAEYEKLLDAPGLAHAILPVQSVTQLTIIALVVLGNALQLARRRSAR
jgi:hypothetical protein